MRAPRPAAILAAWVAAGWDCTGTQTADATTVTRQNVTQFSDWAIGFGVGPTAVQLQTAGVADGHPMTIFVWFALGLGLLTWLLSHVHRKQRMIEDGAKNGSL